MSVMTAGSTWLPASPWTVADLDRLPDDGNRYELIDGGLLVTPAPRPTHQRAVGRIFRLLDDAAPGDIEALVAPLAVRPQGHLPLGQLVTELQPDVVVARVGDYSDRDLPVAPLLAVEVLSPSTQLVDLHLKRAAYERMGAPSYWVLDPVEPSLRVFELDAQGRYAEVALVHGDEVFQAQRPFPVTIRPSDLVAPPKPS
jgi:Uma2 family endonuclease